MPVGHSPDDHLNHLVHVKKTPTCILYSKISEMLNSPEEWVQHFDKAGHSFISQRLACNTAEGLLMRYELLENASENCLNACPLLIAHQIMLFPFHSLLVWTKYSQIVITTKQAEKLPKSVSTSEKQHGQKHLSVAHGPSDTDAEEK